MKVRVSYQVLNIVFEDLINNGSWGEWWSEENLVKIDKSLKGPALVSVLFHELGHACYSHNRPRGEEAVCNSLGNWYSELLSRNKPLRDLIWRNLK